MFKNYFILAYRHIRKDGIYSVINILGLAAGLACFFLIALYVRDEWSYDRFNKDHNRIYRVVGILDLEGQGEQSSSCPFPLGPAIAHDYPHLAEQVVRFFNFQDPQHTLRVGEKKINESKLFLADSNVFKVFDFPLEEGSPDKVLSEPNSIVMTRAMARKYFGDEEPVGKMVKFDGVKDLMVTGVFGALPQQSHIHFDALISFSTIRTIMGTQQKNWVWNPNWTYVKLKPGVSASQLDAEFPAFIQKYYPGFLKPQVTHFLQPLDDIHLHSKYDYEIEPNGDHELVMIFCLIAVFILCIACINFMNLSTARSARRAREIGMRKVAGATKPQLVMQFLLESVVITFISVVLAMVVTSALLPLFNRMAEKQLSIYNLADPSFLLLALCAALITGILSGLYPAFYLSSFKPVQVLKGAGFTNPRKFNMRKVLVVAQFTISVLLIIGTGMVYLQLQYLRSAKLGFERDQVLMLPVRPPMARMYDAFVNEVKGMKYVRNVAIMNDVIGKHHNTHEYNYKGMQPGKWIYFPSLLVNEDFIRTMGIRLIAGRDFSKEFPRDDTMAVIVNEAMVRHMQWGSADNALGQQFYTPTGHEKVVGVVKDFHFESLHTPLGPFVLDMPHIKLKTYWTRYIAVRLEAGHNNESIAAIGQAWNKYNQEFPFDYFFLDEDLNKQYHAQENLARLVTCFSLLAIFIACLGLFALASYSAGQRSKEIGIRKTMGASVMVITRLLSVDFLKLVAIAIVVAWPLAWYVVNKWLQGFAFRTDINYFLFLVSGIVALLIAWLTVFAHAMKAAKQDPVKSLRYE